MKKHAEHILAFDKSRFGLIGPGFNFISHDRFMEYADRSLIIARRRELETDERFAQLLPYIVLWNRGLNGQIRLFTYQRGKGVGESRLAGAYSVGIGGHVDVADVVSAHSIIDIGATMSKSMERELDEEIKFIEFGGVAEHNMHSITRQWGISPMFDGIINDTSDAVGRVHFGALHFMEIPVGLNPLCREPELLTCGLKTLDELNLMRENLENWSLLVVDVAQGILG